MAASIAAHGVLLWLALALRPAPDLIVIRPTTTRITLTAPRMRPSSRPPRNVPGAMAIKPSPESQSKQPARTFAAPTASSVHPARQEVVLPEVTVPALVPPAAPVATPVSTTLPGAPVVLGKLSGAAAVSAEDSVRRQVQSSGFGSEVAAEPALQRSLVARAGFGEAPAAATSQPVRVTPTPRATAVEIISKPRPVYTEEARRLHIEGEVLLEVLFSATGDARVLRVIQGLGYGLDRAASDSVSRIGYRPATREGEPIDQTATVHIVFQLAY